jgi:transcriptional regulator with XRE-family HTH domain
MGTLGADLQHSRELAGLSLDDLSARTKIRRHMLEAIERNDFASIPGGLLARGYLRAYAGEVGLPKEAIAARYRTEFGADEPPLADAFRYRAEARDHSSPTLWNDTIAVTVFIAIVGVWLYVSQRPPVDSVQHPVGTAGRIPAPAEPTDAVPGPFRVTHGSGSGNVDPAMAGALMTVEIIPTRVVWVEATADGNRILYALVRPDQRRVIQARQELLLRVGDAGGFRYVVNGVEGRELGGPGQVREMRITRQNYPAFQRTRTISHPGSR